MLRTKNPFREQKNPFRLQDAEEAGVKLVPVPEAAPSIVKPKKFCAPSSAEEALTNALGSMPTRTVVREYSRVQRIPELEELREVRDEKRVRDRGDKEKR